MDIRSAKRKGARLASLALKETMSNDQAYYLIAATLGFLTGVARAIRNGEYRSIAHSVSVGILAGSMGFSVCAVYFRGVSPGDDFTGLALSSMVGSIAREIHEAIARKILAKLLGLKIDNSRDHALCGDDSDCDLDSHGLSQ